MLQAGKNSGKRKGAPAGRRPRLAAVVWLAVVSIMAGIYSYTVFVYPSTVVGPAQPIPFSHRLHAGVKGINCRFCHPFVDRSEAAGIPEVAKCLYCHNHIIPNHPWIRKEHWYYDNKVPVPWKRLFVAEDHVQFRHRPHIARGFDCSRCHGDVEAMDRLPAHRFQMGFCVGCHRENRAGLSCWLTCHH